MNKEDLIKKYENLEGVWNANGAEIARQCFLRDLELLNEIDTKKVTVPQYVADWIEYCKRHNFTLLGCIDPVDDFGGSMVKNFEGDVRKCIRWCRSKSDILARAWLDGFEVEKEKRYTVKVKAILGQYLGRYYLNNEDLTPQFTRTQFTGKEKLPNFTRKELEEAGFGWVFDCEGMEVKEV